jgi:hypothetical protein
MTAYDLSDLIGARPGFGLVMQHLQNMRCRFVGNNSTSVVNTTSGSLASLISVSLANVLTTDIVIAVAQCVFSCADASRQGVFRLDLGGASGQTIRQENVSGGTGGTSMSIFTYNFNTGLSGTVTADLLYARGGTSTTIYAGHRSVTIFAFKSAS